MSSLLHMLPMGAAWLQWDSERTRQHTQGAMAQDATDTVVVGEDGAGKTSLAFQAAVSLATDHKQVTFIRPKVLSHLPLPVHGMPTPEPTALQLVKLWYPEHVEEVVKWSSHIHTLAVLPDAIIIDDFDVFAGQSKNSEHGAARLCASLLDAAAWVKQKSGHCHLILTASHRIVSIPSVLRQFHFSVVNLTGTCEEDGVFQLSSAAPTYNVCIRYSISLQNIMLSSVDSRPPDPPSTTQ